MDLRLHDDDRYFGLIDQLLGSSAHIFRLENRNALRHGDAVASEQGFTLVFVNLHRFGSG
jgi:hypothetical protein